MSGDVYKHVTPGNDSCLTSHSKQPTCNNVAVQALAQLTAEQTTPPIHIRSSDAWQHYSVTMQHQLPVVKLTDVSEQVHLARADRSHTGRQHHNEVSGIKSSTRWAMQSSSSQ